MKKFKVTWEHVEGDGVNTVTDGVPSGKRHEVIHAEDEREARATFDACHRHHNRLVSVREVRR
ncbi:MAG: hypothetical protein FWG50_07160 [Kiritimatiellaeota bacterium]|nr:hypothetical protein [Kiritimatiellota bacterium]